MATLDLRATGGTLRLSSNGGVARIQPIVGTGPAGPQGPQGLQGPAGAGGGGGGTAAVTNVVAAAGTAQTLVVGNNYLTLNSSSCALTLPAAAPGDEVFLSLKQGGTGNRSVTWPTITWPFNITPVLANGVGAVDEFSIRYDGTVWRGIQTASYA